MGVFPILRRLRTPPPPKNALSASGPWRYTPAAEIGIPRQGWRRSGFLAWRWSRGNDFVRLESLTDIRPFAKE